MKALPGVPALTGGGRAGMRTATSKIEQQLTTLLQRGPRVPLSAEDGDVALDRSAYGILCQLADEGPQRLGVLATVFRLDPSTITRQVQALERAGLAVRYMDALDRRVVILDLTEDGRKVLDQARDYRRARLQQALADWRETDLRALARLLKELSASMDRLPGDGRAGQPQNGPRSTSQG